MKPLTNSAVLPDVNGDFTPCPELMTQEEVIRYLRFPDVSSSKNYVDCIKYLVRIHGLPCMHISRKPLYPLEAVRRWIMQKTEKEMNKKG